MTDAASTEGSTPGRLCPWCSAPLAASDTETCSTCGATLLGENDQTQALPGLTAVDHIAVLEGARAPRQPRNRVVAWLTGSDIDEAARTNPASPQALAPPSPEVRREMLRLQMEAEISQLSAEAESMAADEALALEDSGNPEAAHKAVEAILGTEAAAEELTESPEEHQVAVSAGTVPAIGVAPLEADEAADPTDVAADAGETTAESVEAVADEAAEAPAADAETPTDEADKPADA